MAKGSLAKEEIVKKILETFDGSFLNGKELRIPMEENGEVVQIKVGLTCAKVNIEDTSGVLGISTPAPAEKVEVTEEERQNVQKLMENLGL